MSSRAPLTSADPFLAEAEALERESSASRVEFLAGAGLRVPIVDVGCGNGYAVAEWRRRGVRAFGVDSSSYRMSRWIDERAGLPLVVADATALPFRNGQFGGVYSSGLLEHIGVREQGGRYRFEELPDKHALRSSAVAEMCRIASEEGAVLLDFPNGAFPIDFWHGSSVGSFRLHPIPDLLNPTLRQIRRYASDRPVTVLPLRNRLAFRQVSRRWWGRLLRGPMRLLVRILDVAPRGFEPVRAVLYPFLVVRIEPRR